MNAMIDTLKVARTIESTGLTKVQAETFANVLAEATATSREDLATKEFLRSELSTIRLEIAGVKHDLIRWMLGSQVMLVVILAALANFTKVFG